jgi:streptogramin lyase
LSPATLRSVNVQFMAVSVFEGFDDRFALETDPIAGGHNLGLQGIAVKSNGAVWFTATTTGQIGNLVY